MNLIIKTVMAIGYFFALYMVAGAITAFNGADFKTTLIVGVSAGLLGAMVAIKRKV